MKKNITIVGTGYVGLSTATILANSGYKVHTLDIDEKKIEIIKGGKSYFYEVGLDELIANGLKDKALIPTTSYEDAMSDADIVFSCVGTPDKADGSPNMEYIYSAAESVMKHAQKPFIFVQKSTVPVGTAAKLIEHMKSVRGEIDFEYVSNPEFLREGSAVFDTLNMDRVVLGSPSSTAIDEVAEVYRDVDNLAAGFDTSKISKYAKDNNPQSMKFTIKPFDQRVIRTNLESAELIKVTANAFLALKISFANEIAMLCDRSGADINQVMDGVGLDHRIGRSFLYAGRGYGGGCFPKDVSGLIATAQSFGVEPIINMAAYDVNNHMPEYIINKMIDQIGNLDSKKIAVLGLAFKTGTSDARKSPGVRIANLLSKAGVKVSAYDPEANEEASESINEDVQIKETLDLACEDTDIIVVATPWEELVRLNSEWVKQNVKDSTVVDAVNALNKKELTYNGITYIGVGR